MAGPFQKAKITASAVERLGAGETIADSDLDGFFVRRQKDARVYFVRKFARGQRHYVNIGKHGAEFTPAKARNEALLIIAALRQGLDPALERAKLRGMPTVAEFAEGFLRENYPGVKASTLANYEGTYRNHVKVSLGKFKLDKLTTTDVAGIHRKMRATPRAANHVVDFIGSLYKQARVQKIVPPDCNPCAGIRRWKIEHRERLLSREEVFRLGQVLQDAEAAGLAGPFAVAAIRLLLVTGRRRNEILTLKWSDLDFERKLMRLQDTKTGAKTFGLNPAAQDVLSEVPRVEGNPYVIVGDRPGHHLVNLQKPWKRIRKAAGLDDVRIHDLRHTFASYLASGGASLLVIGKLLGHTQAQTTARYAHLANDPLNEANDNVGNLLEGIMSGREAEVIEPRGRLHRSSKRV